MDKKILILGGTGHAGRLIAKYLLQNTSKVKVVIASRHWTKASALARALNLGLHPDRVTAFELDASDRKSLARAFGKVDMVVVASSTLQYVDNIIAETIRARIDYFDILLSSPMKHEILKNDTHTIRSSGMTCITDGGYHPGMPAALIRYAGAALRGLTHAHVFVALKPDWPSYQFGDETIAEFVEAFSDFDAVSFREGEWQQYRFKNPIKYHFKGPFGCQNCVPMQMEEMRSVPDQFPDIQDCGFYISGFNRVLDNYIMPIIWAGIKYLPRKTHGLFVQLFKFGLRFGHPPYGVHLVAECRNRERKMVIHIVEKDAWKITAVAAVACLLQYLDGIISGPGVYLQGWVVDPCRWMDDIRKMGIHVEVEIPDRNPASSAYRVA